jgi:hypothetical protein
MVAFNCCGTLFLVQPTGGGRCAIQDSFAIIMVGVMLAIAPLLSLGANLANKVMEKASLEFEPVTAFHLTEIKDPAMQQTTSFLSWQCHKNNLNYLFPPRFNVPTGSTK